MISNTTTKKPLKLTASKRLELHFLSLARQLVDWNRRGTDRQTVGVTGSSPKVGASTVAFNLAASLARICSGKVLLVETDFGHPLASKKLPSPSHGLSDVLTLEVNPDDCIQPTTIERLSLMGCGSVAAADAMSISFEALDKLNDELRGTFDFVVYDLPAASDLTPCFSIANQLDGNLVICAADNVDQDRINRIKKRLSYTTIIGLVLNGAK